MRESLFELPVDQQITPYLSLRQNQELPVIVVDHPQVRAAVALQGAQLLAWQPTGETPIIWLSDKANFQPGKAIRGGVPICWPWFGSSGTPAHGFARTQPWQLMAHDEDEQGVTLTFSLKDNPHTHKLWPHEFCLILRLRLDSRCTLELEIWSQEVSTAALHSYFNVQNSREVAVTGLGNCYIDKVKDNQPGELLGPQRYIAEVDRIFTAPEPCSVIEDPGYQRQIEIYHQHHSDVVTWNPGPERSSSMSDMSNEGYKSMVCVETARIHHPLAGGAECAATLAVTFRTRPLN